MTVSMYSVSIPVFIQHLNGLSTVLDKAASWAAARKVNEADLLNMRLSPDMLLRHACGYKLANDGHDTRSLAHYLGHRNLQSTARYTLR
jgi:hypothetical protein